MKIDYAAFTGIIRDRISCADLARDQGIQVNRDNRAVCIFCSGDRTDTLKLYPGNRGYYCFRCHNSGDVIKLYQEITGTSFPDAVKGLNDTYGLGLPLDHTDREAVSKARAEADRRRRELFRKKQEEMDLFEKYLDAADVAFLCEQGVKQFAPASPDAPWDPRFVTALKYREEYQEARDRYFDALKSFS